MFICLLLCHDMPHPLQKPKLPPLSPKFPSTFALDHDQSWEGLSTTKIGNTYVKTSFRMIKTFRQPIFNPIPYVGGGGSPPKHNIKNYGVFCIAHILCFIYLTFHITGLPNFWRKKK